MPYFLRKRALNLNDEAFPLLIYKLYFPLRA